MRLISLLVLILVAGAAVFQSQPANSQALAGSTPTTLPGSITTALRGINVTDVDIEVRKGRMVFEVEIQEGNVEIDLLLTKEGQLRRVDVDQLDEDDDDDGEEDDDEEDSDENAQAI